MIKTEETEEPVARFRWHWQNLTKDDGKGKFPWHGRAWFTCNHNDPKCRLETTINPEWNIGEWELRLSFGVSEDCENTIHWSAAVPGVSLHVGVDSVPLSRFISKHWGTGEYPFLHRSFRFYIHDWGVWLTLWEDENQSRWSDPWWQRIHHFSIPDFFLGKSQYSNVEIETFQDVLIPMPEGSFRATMTYEISTWKRPRWKPVIRKFTRIRIELDAPKFPGKGENSWDCGDDAIWEMSVEGHSLPKAIGGYVQQVMEYRLKRQGGSRLD